MADTPITIVQQLLGDPTNPEVVARLVHPDAVYVSLNFDNPDLKKILPWAGTSSGHRGVIETFEGVGAYWTKDAFEVTDMFGADDKVAVFGSFTYTSNTLGKSITSPFSVLAKVRDGKVAYFQFMEDTFGTASTFRSSGTSTYRSDPAGGEVEV